MYSNNFLQSPIPAYFLDFVESTNDFNSKKVTSCYFFIVILSTFKILLYQK